MNHQVMHLLLHLAAHAVKHMTSHQKAEISQSCCRRCSGAVTPEKSIIFDCCDSLICLSCAGRMVTELGDGDLLVQCTLCGKRRVSRVH